MNLHERLQAKSQQIQQQIGHLELYSKRVLELIPPITDNIANWTSELIGKVPGLTLDINTESLNFFYNFDNRPIGIAQCKRMDIKFLGKSLRFRLDPGIGYIGATAKIMIESNIPNWGKTTGINLDGLFILFDDVDPKKAYLTVFDFQHKTNPFTKTELELFLEKTLG